MALSVWGSLKNLEHAALEPGSSLLFLFNILGFLLFFYNFFFYLWGGV